jgi:hypothetical protein
MNKLTLLFMIAIENILSGYHKKRGFLSEAPFLFVCAWT